VASISIVNIARSLFRTVQPAVNREACEPGACTMTGSGVEPPRRSTPIIRPAMQQIVPSVPGPRDGRGWRIGLGCLGFLSLISAAIAAPVFFGWLALGRYEALSFPASALLYYVPAIATIGLGVWTWRTKRLWWLYSLVAILGGAFGLSFAVVFALFGLLVRLSPSS
jgi:hypothetical protein